MKKKATAPFHPIFNAIFTFDIDEIKQLVLDGCDLNNVFMDKEKYVTPLVAAMGFVEEDRVVVEALVELGADVHHKTPQGDNMLSVCAHNSIGEIFDYLVLKIGHQFDIDEKNNEGETALMIAARSSSVEMINCILKYKPQLKLENKQAKNALEIAKISNVAGVIELLEEAFLIDKIENEKNLLIEDLNSLNLPKNENVHKL